MSKRLTRRSLPIATQLAELSLATPAVMGHRIARMVLAGASPSARDRQEFQGMVSEKTSAFAASWQAMAQQSLRANQALALSCMRLAWQPGSWGGTSARALQTQMVGAAIGVLGKGLAPVHGKAVANAKRLQKVGLIAPRSPGSPR